MLFVARLARIDDLIASFGDSRSLASAAFSATIPALTGACEVFIHTSVFFVRLPIISRLPDSASITALF